MCSSDLTPAFEIPGYKVVREVANGWVYERATPTFPDLSYEHVVCDWGVLVIEPIPEDVVDAIKARLGSDRHATSKGISVFPNPDRNFYDLELLCIS